MHFVPEESSTKHNELIKTIFYYSMYVYLKYI